MTHGLLKLMAYDRVLACARGQPYYTLLYFITFLFIYWHNREFFIWCYCETLLLCFMHGGAIYNNVKLWICLRSSDDFDMFRSYQHKALIDVLFDEFFSLSPFWMPQFVQCSEFMQQRRNSRKGKLNINISHSNALRLWKTCFLRYTCTITCLFCSRLSDSCGVLWWKVSYLTVCRFWAIFVAPCLTISCLACWNWIRAPATPFNTVNAVENEN